MENTALKTHFDITTANGLLTCKMYRRPQIGEFREMLLAINETAIKENIKKVLIDGYSLDLNDLTMSERHDIGLFAAEIFKGYIKVVLVGQKQFINKHGENVANNRGADVLVTDSFDEAREFLSK